MFDWEEVPEELGGPNRSAVEVEAERWVPPPEQPPSEEEEDEEQAEEGLAGLLCLDESSRKVKRRARPQAKPVATAASSEERAALRSLRIGELKRRLADKGIKVPPNVVEKDDLVTLLLGGPSGARAPEPSRRPPAGEMPAARAPPEPRQPAGGAPFAPEPRRPPTASEAPSARSPPEPRAPPVYEAPIARSPPEPLAPPVYEEPPHGGGGPAAAASASTEGSAAGGARRVAPAQRLERMTADIDGQGAAAGDSQLQSSLKQQFQRMKEQRRREEEERKAERQRQAAERQALPESRQAFLAADGPGRYMITKKTLATARPDRGSGKVDELIPGQVVEVLEVMERDGRVRARIEEPPCWFSIVNNASGTRFAEREKPELRPRPAPALTAGPSRRKAPSRFAAFSKAAAASLREESPESREEEPPPPPEEPPPPPAKPSPLAIAARTGSLKKVMQLLQQGSSANAADARGETPLFAAAAVGGLDAVAALLLHAADPNKRSVSSATARDVAPAGPVRSLLDLAQGKFEGVQMGPVISALDGLLRPQVMHMLQDKMRAAAMAQESQRGADGPGPGAAAAASAAPAVSASAAKPREAEQPRQPRALAEEAAKAGSESALTRVCKTGNLREVMRLLQGGADPNTADIAGETPLFEAAAHGFGDVTAALLVYRGDPERRSGTGLLPTDLTTDGTVRGLLAFFRGEDMTSEQLEFLLEGLGETMREIIGRMVRSLEASKRGLGDGEAGEAGAAAAPVLPPRDRVIDTAHLSETPLAAAARAGDLEEVRHLLEDRADPNIRDDLGETPLFEAVASGFNDVTALLLLGGADPQSKSDAGGVASDIAVDPPSKLLLDFFIGKELSNDDKYVVVYEALRDAEVKEAISVRFRTANMRDAYKHTLRKLRA